MPPKDPGLGFGQELRAKTRRWYHVVFSPSGCVLIILCVLVFGAFGLFTWVDDMQAKMTVTLLRSQWMCTMYAQRTPTQLECTRWEKQK